MGGPPTDRCGYTWPEDYEVGDSPKHQSCCWRETADGSARCIWHADPDEVSKPVEALQEARAPQEIRQQNSLVNELLDGARLSGVELGDVIPLESVSLRESDFSDANSDGTSLSGANLRGSDLTDATLQNADLSDIDLRDASSINVNFHDANLSEADFCGSDISGSKLLNADLSGANLMNADFSGADLVGADLSYAKLPAIGLMNFRTGLSDVNLQYANLSGVVLTGSDLSNLDLQDTDLSDSDLQDTDLTDTLLRDADFSSADLCGTDMTGADLREATVTDVSVNGETTCKRLHEGPDFDPEDWDATARAYHDLKTTFSNHGLVGKARKMHVRERRARSLEAKAENGIFSRRYLGSLPSRIFTGYGVRVRNLLIWMLLLFLIPTAIYTYTGVEETLLRNVSYSVLAFTVAPPHIPPEPWVQAIMMVQTFFGTLSIVLLGYILGNRERF